MYPRDYFLSPARVVIGTCFVAMPFSQAFDAVFQSIRDALTGELAFRIARTDELLGGGNVIAEILRGIATSEIVIADLTERNPNVYYELGLAHMYKPVDKVVLLSQDLDSIPFDLRAFRHIQYSPHQAGLASLTAALKQAVSRICEPVHRIRLLEKQVQALGGQLLGPDHSMYQFEVSRAILGSGAVKLKLQVTKTFIAEDTEILEVFRGGLGFSYGQSRRVPDTDWTVRLERGSDNDSYLRILPFALDPDATT